MKAIKKALALCLALAMVVTAVPVSTADAAVKSAKLSKSSVTVAGNATKKQTKSVKVTTNADWKNVKVTASSADKKVATVKVSKKTVKVTAVKKGETKVTVNVTGKKSGKKVSKKLTLKVTVCGAGLAVKAPAELTVGDTAKLAVKTTPSTASCTFDVDKKEVATVSDNGTITAVAPGTAKVVVRTDYGKEKIVTVTVVEAKKDLSITAEATKADTFTITANRNVASDAKVTITKKGLTTAVDGKAEVVDNVITFKNVGNFLAGDYTVEVAEGDVKATAEVSVQNQYVKEIVITSTQALTAKTVVDNDTAYIYYDVLDQYGNSLRTSASITWTTTAGTPKVDKTMGRLEVQNKTSGGNAAFIYGTEIKVIGVYTKTGVTGEASVKVGLPQALDKVEAVGFVNKDDPSKLLTTLPNDFSTGTYVMAYVAKDQDGQVLPTKNYIGAQEVTFICAQPMLIKNTFTYGGVVTVNGEEYNAVNIFPGDYADKGGTFTIDAIANKTGTKTPSTFTLGSNGLLKKLEILGPKGVVADGDADVEMQYIATTTDGETTVDYETIVRSSNALTLNTNVGTLKITENNDGSAKITWSDDVKFRTWATIGADISLCMDGIARPVVFTTIVVGGESSNYQMDVQDKRVPVAIKEVKINGGADAIVFGASEDVKFFAKHDNPVTYIDQYNEVMHTDLGWTDTDDYTKNAKWNTWAPDFFDYFGNHKYGNTDKKYYAILVDYVDANNYFTDNYSVVAKANDTVVWYKAGNYDFNNHFRLKTQSLASQSVVSDTVKYSIVSGDDSYSADKEKWSVAGKALTKSYDVVPTERLASISIGDLPVMHMDTYANQKGLKNGIEAGMTVGTTTGTAIKTVKDKDGAVNVGATNFLNEANYGAARKIVIKGLYKGKNLNLNPYYYEQDDTNFNVTNLNGEPKLAGINADVLTWADLYDSNSPTLARKNAVKQLSIVVKSPNPGTRIKVVKDITMADAPSRLEKAYTRFDKPTVNPDDTVVTIENGADWTANHVVVEDQYGEDYSGSVTITYTTSDYAENTGKYAHVLNNAIFANNGSSTVVANGLELGDTFKVAIKVVDKNDATNVKNLTQEVSVGADKKASLSSGASYDTSDDHTLRLTLKYPR